MISVLQLLSSKLYKWNGEQRESINYVTQKSARHIGLCYLFLQACSYTTYFMNHLEKMFLKETFYRFKNIRSEYQVVEKLITLKAIVNIIFINTARQILFHFLWNIMTIIDNCSSVKLTIKYYKAFISVTFPK